MDEKLKYSLLRDANSNWTRNEKKLWFITLITGTSMLYSTRTTLPLLIPSVASEQKWTKKDSGTILSSFFWGYTMTQVFGGYFSDRIGGQKVIYFAAIGWSIITFLMPTLIYASTWYGDDSIVVIIVIRIINGAFQGVHFPSMISITSQNLNSKERTNFFGMLTSGSAIGTLFTGIVGSFIFEIAGWPSVFRIMGILGIIWTIFLRRYTMKETGFRVINLSNPSQLCDKLKSFDDRVPWRKIFGHLSFWACIIAHACEMNCFFVLLSWLPTYFHESYPEAKGWIVNMIPWLALPPCTLIAKCLSSFLISRGWSVTVVRKVIQSICFILQNTALIIMSHTNKFHTALMCMTIIIGGTGFHNNAVTVNPQDLVPKHAGSAFGLMNTVGAVPGFLGVYAAGYMLEITQNWQLIFTSAALANFFGWIIFLFLGSGDQIV